MTTGEARRLLRESGFRIQNSNSKVEVWVNGAAIIPMTILSKTLGPQTVAQIRSAVRRAGAAKIEVKEFKPHHAKVGVRVRTLREFFGLARGSVGTIEEDYGSGVVIKWDGLTLRDGFDKKTELQFLEII